MNCFRHPLLPAVAVCKTCGKAVCHDCATERPLGIICSQPCEQALNRLERVIDQAQTSLMAAPRAHNASALLYAVSAGMAILFSVYAANRGWFESAGAGALVLGALAGLGAFLQLGRARPAPDDSFSSTDSKVNKRLPTP